MISALNQFTSQWQASIERGFSLSLSYLHKLQTISSFFTGNLLWVERKMMTVLKCRPALYHLSKITLRRIKCTERDKSVHEKRSAHSARIKAAKSNKASPPPRDDSTFWHFTGFLRAWGKREHQGNKIVSNNFPRYFCSRLLSTILSILKLSEILILFKSIDMVRLNNCWTAKFPNNGVGNHFQEM